MDSPTFSRPGLFSSAPCTHLLPISDEVWPSPAVSSPTHDPSLYLRVPSLSHGFQCPEATLLSFSVLLVPHLEPGGPGSDCCCPSPNPAMTLVTLAHLGPTPQSMPGHPHLQRPLSTPSHALFTTVVLGFSLPPTSSTATSLWTPVFHFPAPSSFYETPDCRTCTSSSPAGPSCHQSSQLWIWQPQ